MKISVIIPCHNAGPWILESIRSVARQTYQAHEIIVIDDDSTDDSAERARASGAGVKLIKVACHNAAAARNAGLEAARGEWVAFQDADDIWLPNHLEEAAAMLRGGEDAGYMCHRRLVADDPAGAVWREPLYPEKRRRLADAEFLECFQKRYFNHQGVLLRADVVRGAGGYDATLVRRHDSEMFLRVIKGHTWAYNPVVGTLYRNQRVGNLSGARAECAYYFFLSIANNQHRYPGEVMERLLKETFKDAMGMALRGGDGHVQKRLWALMRGRLSPGRTWFYRAAMRAPRGLAVPVIQALDYMKR